MGTKTKKIKWLLLVIIVLAIFLRVFNVKNTLLFHFDQGYHSLAIREIWENRSIKLLGHKTDIEGIYHGSIFYLSNANWMGCTNHVSFCEKGRYRCRFRDRWSSLHKMQICFPELQISELPQERL